MLFFLPRILKKYQPIGLIGAIRHAGLWLTSGCGDLHYQRKPEGPQEKVKNPELKSSLLKDSEAKASGKDEIAIYCIHGTADRRNSFSFVADRIKDGLPEQITSIHLPAFSHRGQGKSIGFFAQQLKDKIILNKHKNVILMGHSRGCLVASYFAEYLAAENDINVHGVINICGPFKGSKFATAPIAWYSSSVKQMRINSSFLDNLSNKMKTSTNQYYYFAATNDRLVKPSNACIEEHREHLIELDKHTHLSIMSSQRLVGHIQQHIHQIVAKQPAPPREEKVMSLC